MCIASAASTTPRDAPCDAPRDGFGRSDTFAQRCEARAVLLALARRAAVAPTPARGGVIFTELSL